tara:strand:+ start:31062 stop:37184 length:6123 start_codon:yes stop_codon:yes gene_type:complete
MAIKTTRYGVGDEINKPIVPPLEQGKTFSFPYKATDNQNSMSTEAGVHLLIIEGGRLLFTNDSGTWEPTFGATEITITWNHREKRLDYKDEAVFIFNAFTKQSEGMSHYRYVATGGQTTFSGADADGNTLSYSVADAVQVFQNGSYVPQTDYTATSLTSIVLDTGASASDTITVWALQTLVDQTELVSAINSTSASATSATTSATNASNDADDAEKWANHTFNTLFTLSDGVTTGYSAKSRAVDAERFAEFTIGQTFAATGENTSTHYSAKHYANDAANSASSASTSATSTTNSAAAAAASATAAQNALDSFEAIYLGASATDPTTDSNGDPLTVGDQYFNTSNNTLYVYNGSSWQTAGTPYSLAGLSDVDNSMSPSSGQVLQYDGSDWDAATLNLTTTLASLTDTNLTSIQDDQVLQYDNASSQWKNATLNLTTTLASLTDTNISGIQDDHILRYDSASGEWKNEIPGYLTSSNPLASLSDVAMYSGQSSGDVLAWDGSQWDATSGYLTSISSQSIEDLNDVASMTPSNGDVLTWDGSQWGAESGLTSGSSIEDLADVATMNKGANDLLYWDGSEWSNSQNPGSFLTSISGSSIKDLSDVNSSMSPSTNNLLKWSGSEWTADSSTYLTNSSSIEDLTDVGSFSPSMGDLLKWNGSEWNIGNTSLAELTDTNISSPQANQFIRYDSANSNWRNEDVTIPSTMTDLSDVNNSMSPSSGDVLTYSGSEWNSSGDFLTGNDSIENLNDVAAMTPSTGDHLYYNGSQWTNDSTVLTTSDNLDDLNNVQNSMAPSTGDHLYWDGSQWNKSTTTLTTTSPLNSLTDVNAGSPNNGDNLSWDGSAWVPVSSSGTLAGLTDTSISSPSTGQGLEFNGSSWVNSSSFLVSTSNWSALSNVDSSTDTASAGEGIRFNGSYWIAGYPEKSEINEDSSTSSTGNILWTTATSSTDESLYISNTYLAWNANAKEFTLGSGGKFIAPHIDIAHAEIDQLNNFNIPTSGGSSGQFLKTDGGSPVSNVTWSKGTIQITNNTTDSSDQPVLWSTQTGDVDEIFHSSGNLTYNAQYNTLKLGSGMIEAASINYPNGNLSIEGMDWPSSAGNSGEFLQTDGSTSLTWASAGGITVTDDVSGNSDRSLLWASGTGSQNTIYTSSGELTYNPYYNTMNLYSGTLNVQHIEYDSGNLSIEGMEWPSGAGSNGQVLTTDGSTTLSWTSVSSGGASAIDGLSDAKSGGTGFGSSLKLGDSGTGTLNNAYYNVFVGIDSGTDITEGDHNTAVGYSSLNYVTTGYENTSLGSYSGGNILGGYCNVTVGYYAGYNLNSGYENILIGKNAGKDIQTGYDNTIIGNYSGSSSLTGEVWIGAAGSERIKINSSGEMTVNASFTLPSSDGSANQVLQTNGSGTVSWATAGGGASSLNDLSDVVFDTTNFSNSLMLGDTPSGTLNNADYNTFVGFGTGLNVTSGTYNAALGKGSLLNLTSGDNNVAMGQEALSTIQTTDENTAIGKHSMRATNGTYNTGLGADSGFRHVGDGATYIGHSAGLQMYTGDYNTYVGYKAGYGGALWTATGDYNIALGVEALEGVTSGTGNIAVGYQAGDNITSADYNTIIGYDLDPDSATTGGEVVIGTNTRRIHIDNSGGVQFNSAFRFPTADGTSNQVLQTNGSGAVSWATVSGGGGGGASDLDDLSDVKKGGTDFTDSMMIGATSTGTLSSASDNLFIGTSGAGDALTSGTYNIGIGNFSLSSVQDGASNIGVGYSAGHSNNESYGIFIGHQAAQYVTGASPTIIGYHAARGVSGQTTAAYTTAIGFEAGYGVTTAQFGVHLGHRAGKSVTTGGYSVNLGAFAGQDTSTGDSNTNIGYEAGRHGNNIGNVYIGRLSGHGVSSVTGANYNVGVGYNTLTAITSGEGNVCIGKDAGDSITSADNNTIIGTGMDPDSATAGGEIVIGTDTRRIHVDNTGAVQFNSAFRFPAADGSANQVLETDGSGTLSWATVSGGGGSSTLSGLTDVTISTPQNGQVLKYDGSGWVNGTDADSGGGGGGITTGKAIAMAMVFG